MSAVVPVYGLPRLLCQAEISAFLTDGVLVVKNLLSKKQVAETKRQFHWHLKDKFGVDIDNLDATAENLRGLSTTAGAGGIIDLFYSPFRLDVATSASVFSVMSQIWAHTYAKCQGNFQHCHGQFDANKGVVYMNRVCFRVPHCLSLAKGKSKKGKRGIQRGLAPHLDCCPTDLYHSEAMRWRPVQMLVALTDNHSKDTGGFECVKGFHRQFADYFKRKSAIRQMDTVCVGDFCRLLPREDAGILQRMEHLPYEAGDAILFDYRIPHASARLNASDSVVRQVIYTGFLPYVPLNVAYQSSQLTRYRSALPPPDFWGGSNYLKKAAAKKRKSATGSQTVEPTDVFSRQKQEDYEFSPLGKQLMGLAPWSS